MTAFQLFLEVSYITSVSFLPSLHDISALTLCSLSSGKGEAIETTLAALQVVPEPFRSFANTLVDICAYAGQHQSFSHSKVILLFAHVQLSVNQSADLIVPFPSLVITHCHDLPHPPPPGSGNVLKVQQLLHICSEHYEAKEKEKEEDKDKKDKKDKDKKETADMGSHQVWVELLP